jgi:D-glucuronyl C5-epimerase C-terminus
MMHFRPQSLASKRSILVLSLLCFLLAGCWPFPAPKRGTQTGTPTPNQSGTSIASSPSGKIDTIVQQVFENVRQNGWNPQTGGLYTNWQMDDPSITNNLSATDDPSDALKHDPQVELFYLMSLADYHALHPDDHRFDAEIQRTKQVVLSEIKGYAPFKGWMYFFLQRSGKFLNDPGLENAASDFARSIYTNWYDPQVGVVYNRRAQSPNYQPNLALQAGAAMIDAGMLANQPDMIQAGQKTIDHVLSVAIDPQYHLLYNILTVGTGGSQDQVMNTSRYKGYQAKPSTQGEAATALILAYNETHDQQYLNAANQLLQTLLTSPLLDRQRGGFYFARDMDTGKLEDTTKETRSQNLVLIALHNYDLTMKAMGMQQPYVQQEQALITVLTDHFYQPTYHGFFYRVASDFSIFRGINNQGKFFTSEAMGSTTDALQQTEFTIVHP